MRKPIRRALVSVYDKNRLIEIGTALSAAGVEILSTGSTAKNLADAGIPVVEVSQYTGFPEIMGGRVKTLHPRIHSGILADHDNSEHMAAIAHLEIAPFDLVIINLYPFAETIASGASFEESIEQIDIGGPAMLRGAAKNHGSVAVISHTSQYDQLLEAINSGGFTEAERRQLALHVFRTTAQYDLAIATWLGQAESNELPEWFGQIWQRKSLLRYGENPHQGAAIYSGSTSGIVDAQQLHGKEMSFNNYTDADAAWRAVLDHRDPAVAIMKHANPCGVAVCEQGVAVAYQHAHECDPVSAFGGVVAANRKVDLGIYDLTATTINGVNATNYIKTSGTGKLIQTLANNASVTFPIGNTTYNPVAITNKSGASDVFSARVLVGAFMEGLTGAAITSTVLNRTWDISKTNANGFSFGLALSMR